jgi:hypothetical protein
MLCHYTRQYVKEQFLIVELVGFEPTTPCLQSRCSSQLSYSPLQESCVGLGGVEPPTSRLSGVRSNHLSYKPSPKCLLHGRRKRSKSLCKLVVD